jgi:hypothetical protein
MSPNLLYAIALEFDSPSALVKATKSVRERGFTKYEVYSPYPVKQLDEIVPGTDPVPLMVLSAGVLGAVTALVMEYYIAVYEYPINVGGRPLNSWPSFIPITFELTVLFAAIAAFIGMLWLAGLPLLHHPVFNLPEFARASSDRFFLMIEERDPMMEIVEEREWLNNLGALSVSEVESR